MKLHRRELLTFASAGAAIVSVPGAFASGRPQANNTIRRAAPITREERVARIARLQSEMKRRKISTVLIEGGSTLRYFTGVQWGRSERFTGAVIPIEGPALFVTPFFEESRVNEMLDVPGETRVWQEHESPFKLVADWLREKKLASGTMAVEETVRFFIADGIRALAPDLKVVSGADIVNALRMYKSPSEIALLQEANDTLIAAYRATHKQVEKGMSVADISAIMRRETTALGGAGAGGGVQFGPGAALPHGSKTNPPLSEGTVVLMDCVCNADGYVADISRTFVFGEPTKEMRTVWQHAREGQDVAMEAAKIGAPAGSVDDAVRAYYDKLGYGPRYDLPGLSHRTGHGIGLDVHEPINLVHGEMTPLGAGMAFSNEPGIYLPGKFGIRHEDCFYMTEQGPRYFTQPSRSLEDPMS